ncbi:MAG: SRPBCC domain-containing protein [Saprospiraceae bacterium]|nr:SRPBCC domain-containing protein [Saprospiraceae bacterium]
MNQIQIELPIRTTVDQLFKAVSDPGELEKWWPLKCAGVPKMGASYNFYFGEEYDWYAEVIKLIPNQIISFKMTRSDADWDPTTLQFSITEEKDQVWILLGHSDWPENNRHFRHSAYCWADLLKGLKDLLEKGLITNFCDRS